MCRLLLQATAQGLLNRTQLQAKAIDLLVLDAGHFAALLQQGLLVLDRISPLALGRALDFIAQLALQRLLQGQQAGHHEIGGLLGHGAVVTRPGGARQGHSQADDGSRQRGQYQEKPEWGVAHVASVALQWLTG